MKIPSPAAESLRASITKIVAITDAEFLQFLDQHQFRSLKRKELLIQQGEVCHFTAFIVRGSLRYFYEVDGGEHTGQFFFENGWYTDYDSFLSGKPSQQNIEALEKTDVLLLEKKHLEELYNQNPRFERFGRLMAERAYLGVRKRTESLTNQSAEERYLQLVKDRPKVIERIPQHYIASYLGIQPQSLSRIRKQILENS